MTDEMSPVAFGGVDWATEKHDVCVVDREGLVLGERAFAADAAGLAAMATWIEEAGGAAPGRIHVGIEVPHGPVVETLMERGFGVYSINPKQLDRFRDRFTVAGAKDDRRDARALADSLRTDGRAYRRLVPDDPVVVELREWSRMGVELKRENTRLCNRARHQLLRYFPQVLELTDDVGEGWVLDLLDTVPRPQDAHHRRVKTIEKILRTHRIRRWSAAEVLTTLRKPAVTVAAGTVEAATGHLRLLSARIRLVRRQIAECHGKLDELSERVGGAESSGGEGQENKLRDVEILRSLPGVGRIVAATLLAEASHPLRDRDYHALRALMGVAPVMDQSGKRRARIFMRRACNPWLRDAAYHWARVATQCDPHWRARYQALRAKGHSHGRACRGVVDAMLRVAVVMLRTRTLYDPKRRPDRRAA
jgi:transposase